MSSESGSYTISYSYNNINNITNQYAPINIIFNINQSNSINQGYSDENFPSITDSESITYPGIDLVFNLKISNNIPSLSTPIIIFRTQNDITSNVPTIIGGQITFSINNTYTTFIITSASFTESTSNPLITNGIYAYSYNIVGNIFNGITNFTNLSYFLLNSQLSYFNDGNQPLYQSNSNEFTSQYNDGNFPAIPGNNNNNISGIIINVDTSNNTFNITFNTTNFLLDNENFTRGTDMTIYFYLNNTTYGSSDIEYNTTNTNPYSNYPILYSIIFKGNLQNNPYIPTPSTTIIFSPAASNQAATTKRQTRALLSLVDPNGKHIDDKNQEKIANESGKIAAHVVSVSEGIKLIGNALAKR